MENPENVDYIERKSLADAIEREYKFSQQPARQIWSYVLDLIANAPAPDVAPVVHGKWVMEIKYTYIPVKFDDNGDLVSHPYTTYRCNICGRYSNGREPYCHCGAKMDLL